MKAHTDPRDIVTKGGESHGLDKLLDQKPLANLHTASWERHHIKHVSAVDQPLLMVPRI